MNEDDKKKIADELILPIRTVLFKFLGAPIFDPTQLKRIDDLVDYLKNRTDRLSSGMVFHIGMGHSIDEIEDRISEYRLMATIADHIRGMAHAYQKYFNNRITK